MTPGPDYTAPELETPAAFSEPLPSALLAPAGTAEAAYWWRGYGDPALERLVQQALAGNLEIAAAEARLLEARALVGGAESDLGPSIGLQAGADGRQILAGGRRSDEDFQGSVEGGLTFSWMPDLFGGEQRGVEAALAEERRRALLRDDLQRTTVADVVRFYVEYRRAQVQLELIESSLSLQRRNLELAEQRYQAGLAAQLDVFRAEAELAATQAQRGPLERDMGALRAALAVLTGQAPGALSLQATPSAIPVFSSGPAVGLPRDLLRARPDVQAAEANLARATAEIGVAEAQYYPQLNIPGALTASATGLGTARVIESLIATLAATLEVTLFDSGGRRAEVEAAKARTQEALLLYRQTLLDALAETETALAALQAVEAERASRAQAVAASEASFQQAQQLYTEGIVGFIDVLDAERTLLTNRQNLIEVEAAEALARADLYSALGAPVTAGAYSEPSS